MSPDSSVQPLSVAQSSRLLHVNNLSDESTQSSMQKVQLVLCPCIQQDLHVFVISSLSVSMATFPGESGLDGFILLRIWW